MKDYLKKRLLKNKAIYDRLSLNKPNVQLHLEEIGDIPEIVVTFNVEEGLWTLRHAVTIPVEEYGNITIPAGYKYDLASVPDIVWPIIAPFELSLAAPLVHDYIYEHRGHLPSGQWFSRKDADKIFLQLMKKEKVSAFKRRVSYLAVRWFAGRPWTTRP